MIPTVIVVVLYVCVFFYRLDERLTSITRLCARECTCVVYIEGVYRDSDGDYYCIVCLYFYCRLDERLTSITRLCAPECTCIVYVDFCYRFNGGSFIIAGWIGRCCKTVSTGVHVCYALEVCTVMHLGC